MFVSMPYRFAISPCLVVPLIALFVSCAYADESAPDLLADLNTSDELVHMSDLFVHNGEARFITSDGLKWRTDGTPEGTLPYAYGSPSFTTTGIQLGATVLGANYFVELQGDEMVGYINQCHWDLEIDSELCAFAEAYGSPYGNGNPKPPASLWNNCYFFGAPIGSAWDGQLSGNAFNVENGLKIFCPDTDTMPRQIRDDFFFDFKTVRYRNSLLFKSYSGNSGGDMLLALDSRLDTSKSFHGIAVGLAYEVKEVLPFNDAVVFSAREVGAGFRRSLFSVELPATEGEDDSSIVDDWAAASVETVATSDGTFGLAPEGLTIFDGKLFFCGSSVAAGSELWQSDGSTIGTNLYADLLPGESSSSPGPFIVAHGLLYFYALLPSGDHAIYTLAPGGAQPVLIHTAGKINTPGWKLVGDQLFTTFKVQQDFESPIAWSTDGTPEGTGSFSLLHPNVPPTTRADLFEFEESVLIRGSSSLHTLSSATDPGVQLADFRRTGNSTPFRLLPGNGATYFSTREGLFWELTDTNPPFERAKHSVAMEIEPIPVNNGVFWRAEKVSYTFDEDWGEITILKRPLKFASPNAPKSVVLQDHIASAIEVNGLLAIEKHDAATPIGRTDGTVEGTVWLQPPGITGNLIHSDDSYLVHANDDHLYFVVGQDANATLWVTDLTTEGTIPLAQARHATRKGIVPGVTIGGLSYFSLYTAANRIEPWRSDGTPEGTRMLADLAPGSASSFPAEWCIFNGAAIFSGTDGTSSHLWHVDPLTDAVTDLVDLQALGIANITALRPFGSLLYFVATANEQTALWRTDGTHPGTFPLAPTATDAVYVAWHAPKLIIARSESGTGFIQTDGTAEGTTHYGPENIAAPAMRIGNRLAARLYSPETGHEFAALDFTTGEIMYTTDLYPGPIGSMDAPHPFTRSGGNIYFAARDQDHGTEPWTYPGSPGLDTISRLPLPDPFDNTAAFAVKFSAPVSNVDTTDFTLAISGNPGATIEEVLQISPDFYRVNIAIQSQTGRIKLLLRADNDITNPDGDPLGGNGDGSSDYRFGEVFVWSPIGEGEGEGAGEGEGEGEGEEQGNNEGQEEGEGEDGRQSADQDGDFFISLSELLRVIQFYNSLGLHCDASTEDGYAPGPTGDTSCSPHNTDYNPQDWTISLTELLRVVQFYNSLGYNYCPSAGTEDNFCPGPA